MVWDEFDEETLIYDGKWTVEAIKAWAIKHSYPTLAKKFPLTKYSKYYMEETGFDASVVAVLDIKQPAKQDKKDDDEDEDEDEDEEIEGQGGNITQDVFDILRFLIPKYPKWRFAYEKFDELTTDKEKKKEMDLLGVVPSTYEPSLTVLQGDKKFLLKGAASIRDLETVTGFFLNVSKGTARQDYLSEPDPETEKDKDGILTLTGKNFPKHAFDPEKDVFVFFTATGVCEKCKELEPEWKKLAKFVKGGVQLGKLETMKNRCEEETDSIPKLVLYPAVAANKKMIKRQVYRGALKADLMLDFLVENSRHEVKSDEL